MSATDVILALGYIVLGVLAVPGALLLMSFNPFPAVSLRPEPRARLLFSSSVILCVALLILISWFFAGAVGTDPVWLVAWTFVLVAGYAAVRSALRRFVWDAWRRGALSHQRAAVILAFIGPGGLLILAAVIGSVDLSVPIMAIAAVTTLVSAYGMALFVLHWLGGEYDPPASRGYRRRP